jgi:LmbE family N-acetylglucosaminyl deacetylase
LYIEEEVMTRILAVMAHPDDAEIWCGGTLIRHTENGDVVRICSMSYEDDSLRGKEAREGARRMGCELEFFGLKDSSIRDTDDAADRLKSSIDAFRPETIITHWFEDMHPDHEATFHIIRRALVKYFLGNPEDVSFVFPRCYCCDTYNSLGLHGPFEPDRFVDVTTTWEKKAFAIRAHESQITSHYLEMIDRQCLNHGKTTGVQRAEGFLYVPLFGLPEGSAPLGR